MDHDVLVEGPGMPLEPAYIGPRHAPPDLVCSLSARSCTSRWTAGEEGGPGGTGSVGARDRGVNSGLTGLVRGESDLIGGSGRYAAGGVESVPSGAGTGPSSTNSASCLSSSVTMMKGVRSGWFRLACMRRRRMTAVRKMTRSPVPRADATTEPTKTTVGIPLDDVDATPDGGLGSNGDTLMREI